MQMTDGGNEPDAHAEVIIETKRKSRQHCNAFDLEEPFQVETASLLNYVLQTPEAYWFHIPNQSPFNAESPHLIRAGARMKKQGRKAGIPDNCVVYAGRAHFIELKSKTGTLSPAQKIVIPALKSAGSPVEIARTLEDVMAALVAWGIPLRHTLEDYRSFKTPHAKLSNRVSASEFRAVMGLDAETVTDLKQKALKKWKATRAANRRRMPTPTRNKPNA